MVKPDREMPGITANPWINPSKNTIGQEKTTVFSGRNRSEMTIKIPVIINVDATMGSVRSTSKYVCTKSATGTVINVATISFHPNIPSSLSPWQRFRVFPTPRNMIQSSLQKNITIAKSPATCRLISRFKFGFVPNQVSNKKRCPLDETGKNSVNPCTNPRKICSKKFIPTILARVQSFAT